MQNAAHTTAAKMKRGAITRPNTIVEKNDYVVRLLGSQSTIFRAQPRNKKAAGLTPGALRTSRMSGPRPRSDPFDGGSRKSVRFSSRNSCARGIDESAFWRFGGSRINPWRRHQA